MPRRILLALSLSNLILLRIWFDLLSISKGDLYLRRSAPLPFQYQAAVLNLFVLAAFIVLLAQLREIWSNRIFSQCCLFAAIGLGLNSLRAVAGTYTDFARAGLLGLIGARPLLAIGGAAVALMAFVVTRQYRRTLSFATALLTLAAPASAIAVGSAVYRLWRPFHSPEQPRLTPLLSPAASPPLRVVWVVFDEWDERFTFDKGLQLPAIRFLASRSVVAHHALGPLGRVPLESMATALAVPSLIYGRPVPFAEAPTGTHDTNFGAPPNLFSIVHSSLGLNVAIGGWYLPYCRAFASDAWSCYWDVRFTQPRFRSVSLPAAMLDQARSLAETSLFSVFGQSLTSQAHAAEYQELLRFAAAAAKDQRNALVFLHFNAPHPPYFYDAARETFNAPWRGLASGYLDELKLVDRTVDELVRNGDDGKTVLILSADHPLRSARQIDGIADMRVPFIVHWPGEEQPIEIGGEFSTLLTSNLIEGILRRTVESAKDVQRFVEDREQSGFGLGHSAPSN